MRWEAPKTGSRKVLGWEVRWCVRYLEISLWEAESQSLSVSGCGGYLEERH